jgi:hypothetical protein
MVYMHDRRRQSGIPRPAARFRRRPPRRASQDAGVGTLYWLAVLGAGLVAASCIGLGMSSPFSLAPAGNYLRAALTIPKLNTVQTEEPALIPAPALAEPTPSEPAPQERNTAEPVHVVEWQLLPVLPRLLTPPQPAAAVDIVPVTAVAERSSDSTVFLPSREPTPGESPMIRTWHTLAAAALLAAAAPPVVPAGETPTGTKEVLKKVDELRTTVEALSKKVDGLAAKPTAKDVLTDLQRIEKAVLEQIDKVNRDLKLEMTAVQQEQLKQKLELQSLGGKMKAFEEEMLLLSEKLMKLRKQVASETPVAPLTTPTGDKTNLDDIRSRLGAIEKALAALPSKERVAFSPPVNGSGASRVLLTNLYQAPALFTLNGRELRRVEPNQTVEIRDVPSGALTYEVFVDGWGNLFNTPRITRLSPNETLTLTAK